MPLIWRRTPFLLRCCRFRAGHRAGDVLPDRPVHAPVLLVLPEHRRLLAGDAGGRRAHLEHSAAARGLPRAPHRLHQPVARVSLGPAPRQRLRGVALLNPSPSAQRPPAGGPRTRATGRARLLRITAKFGSVSILCYCFFRCVAYSCGDSWTISEVLSFQGQMRSNTWVITYIIYRFILKLAHHEYAANAS